MTILLTAKPFRKRKYHWRERLLPHSKGKSNKRSKKLEKWFQLEKWKKKSKRRQLGLNSHGSWINEDSWSQQQCRLLTPTTSITRGETGTSLEVSNKLKRARVWGFKALSIDLQSCLLNSSNFAGIIKSLFLIFRGLSDSTVPRRGDHRSWMPISLLSHLLNPLKGKSKSHPGKKNKSAKAVFSLLILIRSSQTQKKAPEQPNAVSLLRLASKSPPNLIPFPRQVSLRSHSNKTKAHRKPYTNNSAERQADQTSSKNLI